MKQIAAIARDINSGKLKLPDITLDSDEENEALWALLDSGSALHVANASKFFPGAKIVKPAPGAPGFKAANDSVIEDKGTFETPIRTDEGLDFHVKWKNADVAMPILSTHEIAKGNRSLEYFEHDGNIHHLESVDVTKFVEGGGVYCMKS